MADLLSQKHKIGLFNDWNRAMSVHVVKEMTMNGNLTTPGWKSNMSLDLLGLTAYHQLLEKIDTSIFGEYQDMINDIIKTLTILFVSKLLTGKWKGFQNKVVYTIIGICIYYMVIKKHLHIFVQSKLGDSVDLAAIEDWVATIVITSINDDHSKNWLSELTASIAGLTMYHLVVKNIANMG